MLASVIPYAKVALPEGTVGGFRACGGLSLTAVEVNCRVAVRGSSNRIVSFRIVEYRNIDNAAH